MSEELVSTLLCQPHQCAQPATRGPCTPCNFASGVAPSVRRCRGLRAVCERRTATPAAAARELKDRDDTNTLHTHNLRSTGTDTHIVADTDTDIHAYAALLCCLGALGAPLTSGFRGSMTRHPAPQHATCKRSHTRCMMVTSPINTPHATRLASRWGRLTRGTGPSQLLYISNGRGTAHGTPQRATASGTKQHCAALRGRLRRHSKGYHSS